MFDAPTHRRRFLQILGLAPFAPWREILEEAAKPKIFYSIPALPAGVPLTRQMMNKALVQAIELESWSRAIPDLIYSSTRLYRHLRQVGRSDQRPPFQLPLRLVAGGIIQ